MFGRIFFALALLFLPNAAFSASSVSLSMPPSATVQNTVDVYAYYYNDSVFVPDASCTLRGGFLGSPVNLAYYPGQYYLNSLYLSQAGTHTFNASCSKAGYEPAWVTGAISVSKLPTTLSLNAYPSGSATVGESVSFNAYYTYISSISGATCTLKVTKPSGSEETISMYESTGQYSASYKLSVIGQYSFEATCSSTNYATNTGSTSIQSSKHSSTITRPDIPTQYAGGQMGYRYRYESGGSIITGADCNYELKRGSTSVGTGKLSYDGSGYFFSRAVPDISDTSYLLRVTCNSDSYSQAQNDAYFQVKEIPTNLQLTSTAPDGMYSYTSLSLSARYTDSRNYADIYGGQCTIDFDGKHTVGSTLNTEFPAVDSTGTFNAKACCSKAGYATRCADKEFIVLPQPITLEPINLSGTYIAGKDYLLGVVGKPTYYGEDIIACSLDIVDSKSGAAVRGIVLRKNGDEHKGFVTFDKAGRFRLDFLCSGTGYAQNRRAFDAKVKMFSSAFEGTLTTVLGILGIILAAATILISKKYKI